MATCSENQNHWKHLLLCVQQRPPNFLLQALSSLPETELPPAVGLALKLASETESSRPAAIHAVRTRIRAQRDTANGTLDAVRLAMSQHSEVAAAMLADIDSECRTAKSASPMEVCGRPCIRKLLFRRGLAAMPGYLSVSMREAKWRL